MAPGGCSELLREHGDQTSEGFEIAQVDDFDRRMRIAPRPRQPDVDRAAWTEHRGIGRSLRDADLQWHAGGARQRDDTIDGLGLNDGARVEAPQDGACAELRVPEMLRKERAVRGHEGVHGERELRSKAHREEPSTPQAGFFLDCPRERHPVFHLCRIDSTEREEERRDSGPVVQGHSRRTFGGELDELLPYGNRLTLRHAESSRLDWRGRAEVQRELVYVRLRGGGG